MVVYLVRSLGLMPESTSHDWHVQPSCQRPNRGPPERCEFSPGEECRNAGEAPAPHKLRLSSKLDKHTVRRKSRQSTLPTEFPDDFHIGNSGARRESCQRKPKSRFLTIKPFGMTNAFDQAYAALVRATVWSSGRGQNATFGEPFGQPRYGRQEIEKRSYLLGGPCFEGTLRNVFR